MNEEKLVALATAVRKNAYAPYSNFSVGAALLAKSDKVFVGCNVENISFRLTVCAEEAAVAAAVAAGEKEFLSIAIVTDSEEPAVPCGACRQVLAEFNPHLEIATATLKGRTQKILLSELLPLAKQGILESLHHV